MYDFKTVHVTAYDFFIEGFSVMCDPHFSFAERVCAADGVFWRYKILVLDDFGNPVGLFFGWQTSYGRVQISLFCEKFRPKTYRVHWMLT